MTVQSLKLTLPAAFLSCCLVGFLTGVALAQDSRSAQNQPDAPAGKRKLLHEYGPEDILPEAKENQNKKPVQTQAQPAAAGNKIPRVSGSAITPKPIVTRILRPKAATTPAPVESATPVVAAALSTPQQTNSPTAPRRKLLISVVLFLLLLLALVFFVAKMLRQLRGASVAVTPPTLKEQPAAGGRQLRADG